MKKTQCEKIVERLIEFGEIDNFYCIDNKLTYRLGARIFDLKKLGWEFRTEKKGKNCYYYPISWPIFNAKPIPSFQSSSVKEIVETKQESVVPVGPSSPLRWQMPRTSSQGSTLQPDITNETSTLPVENAIDSLKAERKNMHFSW